MSKFASKVRIGEKIGFGFGLVGLLFLGVIWQYHNTLQRSLGDYQQLLDVYEAKKSHALAIENSLLDARRAEIGFLLQRDEALVQQVDRNVDRVVLEASALGEIDESGKRTAGQIAGLVATYQQRFQAIVESWRTKGLDHNSGLQGAFRNTVHELEAMAGDHKVGRLYLQLLQIRRGEKDLGLRREEQYRTKVLTLIHEFGEATLASELEDEVKERLLAEIETYRQTFESYTQDVLANEDIHGGKGPFRDAAHRVEALLNAHYVPDLESNILQLRRREKDYLLRDDKQYVDMVLRELHRIRTQVAASAISAADKTQFTDLLGNYERDFLALVEQNDRIARLTKEIWQVVSEISLLARENVDEANQAMVEMAESIQDASAEPSAAPNRCLITWANQVADNAASYVLQILHGIPNAMQPFSTPRDVANPLGLRFSVSIGNRLCDHSTNDTVWHQYNQEMIRRVAATEKQSLGLRIA